MQSPRKLNRASIIELASGGPVTTARLAREFNVSRQYVSRVISYLIKGEELIPVGAKPKIAYTTPAYAKSHLDIFPHRFVKKYTNRDLEEHMVLEGIENNFPRIFELKEHVRNIFTYAFSEMFNNAIEHSKSKTIHVVVGIEKGRLFFAITDRGIGVFRNVMRERHLRSELEAIQDLLKGKVTTQPRAHSGEGIFFTSKTSDTFILNSYDHRLTIDNISDDVSVKRNRRQTKGTNVFFTIALDTEKHLNDAFRKYTNTHPESDYGFDKTEVKVKLYLFGGIHVSRSQARRVLSGLEKFRTVILDFDKVPNVGQAFADEVFRIFKARYPEVEIVPVNMNDAVSFMVNRVEGNNPRTPSLFNDLEKNRLS